ncbi:MAG: alpha/beta fold hydrolase [Gammaproteobacteria bacterium]
MSDLQLNEKPACNLVSMRADGQQHPLFLIHPSASRMRYAASLARWIDDNIPVYALEVGHINGDAYVESIAQLYVKAIREVRAAGPYRIAGHAFGGIIAYEIANQLLGADEVVEFVGLIETRIEADHPTPTDDSEGKYLLRLIGQNLDQASPHIVEQLDTLSNANDVQGMLALCAGQDFNPLPEEFHDQPQRLVIDTHYAHHKASTTYFVQSIHTATWLFNDIEHAEAAAGEWKNILGQHLRVVPIDPDSSSNEKDASAKKLGETISTILSNLKPDDADFQHQRYFPTITIQSGNHGSPALFCIPGAGGSATSFFALAQELGAGTPVYGLQPRGLDASLVPHVDVVGAASVYRRAIQKVSPKGPYDILGHSFGGWVAFEIAQQLLAAGEQISTLIILDAEAPSADARKTERWSRVDMLMKLIDVYELSIEASLDITSEQLETLGHDQQLELLLSRLARANIMRTNDGQALRGIVRVFETNLNTRYEPAAVFPGTIHLVGVAESSVWGDAEPEAIDHGEYISNWQSHASDVYFWEAPGNHMTLLRLPNVQALAHKLTSFLQDNWYRCNSAPHA